MIHPTPHTWGRDPVKHTGSSVPSFNHSHDIT